MARILIAEDDNVFASALAGLLESNGHRAVSTLTGEEAISILENEDFDCIISDFQMLEMDGLQLVEWVKQHRSTTPLILITGHMEALATARATNAGAADLLYKPFTREEILRAIDFSLNPARPRQDLPFYPSFEGFAVLPVAEVVRGLYSECNIYAEFDGRLRKISNRGEVCELDQSLRDKPCLYTEIESLNQLIPLQVMNLKAASKTRKIDPRAKSQLLKNSIELLSQKIKFQGIDQEAVDTSIEFIKCFLHNVNSADFWELISGMQENGSYSYSHTLASTAVSVMLAQRNKLSIADCYNIAVAALFQDVGKLKLDPNLINRPTSSLTPEERKILRSHVELGSRILRETGLFPSEICDVILQHHENCNGTGYPNKLHRDQIHIMARIIHIADEFCFDLLRTKPCAGLAPQESATRLRGRAEYDQDIVASLESLCRQMN